MHHVTAISIMLTVKKPGVDCEPSLVSLGSASSASPAGEANAHVRLALLWSLELDGMQLWGWRTAGPLPQWFVGSSLEIVIIQAQLLSRVKYASTFAPECCLRAGSARRGSVCTHLCQAGAEGSTGTSLGWEGLSDDLRKVLRRKCV